jgi:hypothetical protein
MMPANWAHVSGCRAGRECVFYQDGKGKFDFQPVTVPAGRGSGEASSAMSRSPTHAVTRSHAAGTSGAGTKASTPTPKSEATFKGVVEDVNTSGHTMGQARRGMPLRRLLVRTDPRKNRARVSGGRPPVTGD